MRSTAKKMTNEYRRHRNVSISFNVPPHDMRIEHDDVLKLNF